MLLKKSKNRDESGQIAICPYEKKYKNNKTGLLRKSRTDKLWKNNRKSGG
jgi:hypothetical protein